MAGLVGQGSAKSKIEMQWRNNKNFIEEAPGGIIGVGKKHENLGLTLLTT